MELMSAGSVESSSPELIEGDIASRSEELQGAYGDVIERMKVNSPGTNLMHFAKALSYVNTGWTPELREDYFRLFASLMSGSGGASFNGFVLKIRDNALERVPPELVSELRALSGQELFYVPGSDLASLPQPQGPGKNWEVQDLVSLIESSTGAGNIENGAKMYQAALCATCHSFQGSGGNSGPDLTQVATRFGTQDLMEALVNPDNAISDQYAAAEITLTNQRLVWGRVVNETVDSLFINENPLNVDQITKIAKSDVEERKISQHSIMFPALLNRLNAQEVRDLISYLQSVQTEPNP